MIPQLEMNDTDFSTAIMNVKKFLVHKTLSKLGQPINKTDWSDHSDVMQVNAFYNPLENSIGKLNKIIRKQ